MTKIDLPTRFADERGFIQTLLNEHNGSIVVIDTIPNVQRANHYHKHDYHYCYIISGKIIYYERPAGSKEPPTKYEYIAGDMFYTPPMVEHCMYFPEKTIFVTLSGGTRLMVDYENDLVRVESLKEIYEQQS